MSYVFFLSSHCFAHATTTVFSNSIYYVEKDCGKICGQETVRVGKQYWIKIFDAVNVGRVLRLPAHITLSESVSIHL